MDTVIDLDANAQIPDHVPRTIVSPKSHAGDDAIYPAFNWLRHNLPMGVANVDGYDPTWVVTKHSDIRAIERDAKLFHNADHNSILNDQASDNFITATRNVSLRGACRIARNMLDRRCGR
ncbi:hypothetical protein [Sphingobium sp.]|uniref:hypothetical protein n=1 Tax=Sphingobium sp. TaxID=1912891 RepID=UPI002B9277A4|nr:hypothetical protein [Sphingobium sp.]HUD92559.1 hypothetical protein [Sphingobium sp.]